jgi:hypothetical protein
MTAQNSEEIAGQFRKWITLSHNYLSKRKMTAMLQVYLDESDDGRRDHVYAIGGWLADMDVWSSFISKWHERITAERTLASFHMADCESGWGEFREWPRERRQNLIKDLIKLIVNADIRGFGAAVSMEDYQKVYSTLVSDLQRDLLGKGDPHLLVFMQTTLEICMSVNQLPAIEKVHFVYHRKPEIEHKTLRYFNVAQSDSELPFSVRMGTLSFSTKEDVLPLQAADIIAYELMKMLLNRKERPELNERKSFSAMKSKIASEKTRFFDEPSLSRFIELADAMRSKI